MLEGLRGEDSIAELCRREGIAQSLYYKWSNEFLEAGKSPLAGDTKHDATSSEVEDMRWENGQLKQAEKMEIIRLVEQADVPVKQVLAELGVPAAPSMTGITTM